MELISAHRREVVGRGLLRIASHFLVLSNLSPQEEMHDAKVHIRFRFELAGIGETVKLYSDPVTEVVIVHLATMEEAIGSARTPR